MDFPGFSVGAGDGNRTHVTSLEGFEKINRCNKNINFTIAFNVVAIICANKKTARPKPSGFFIIIYISVFPLPIISILKANGKHVV